MKTQFTLILIFSGIASFLFAQSNITSVLDLELPNSVCENTIVVPCDDADPCTENDMQEIDAENNAIVCVPCYGTPIPACFGFEFILSCDDGDPCTQDDFEVIDACDPFIICEPCSGTPLVNLRSDDQSFDYELNVCCPNFVLEGDFSNCNIFVLDENENVVMFLLNTDDKIIINTNQLPNGLHFIRVEHQIHPELSFQEIIKAN